MLGAASYNQLMCYSVSLWSYAGRMVHVIIAKDERVLQMIWGTDCHGEGLCQGPLGTVLSTDIIISFLRH